LLTKKNILESNTPLKVHSIMQGKKVEAEELITRLKRMEPLLLSSMKLLSWNCRGFSSKSKVESLKDLVKIENPSVILLQEMEMEDSTALDQAKKALRSGERITINSVSVCF
jgi:hypothetical protein